MTILFIYGIWLPRGKKPLQLLSYKVEWLKNNANISYGLSWDSIMPGVKNKKMPRDDAMMEKLIYDYYNQNIYKRK